MSMEIAPIPGQPGLFRTGGFPQDVVITEGAPLAEMATPGELLTVVLAVPIMFYALKLMIEPREG